MKDHLRHLVGTAPSTSVASLLVRDYLQAAILEGLQRSGAMVPLAFHGGTALRILFGLPRYSEDLDFALERPGAGGYDLETGLRAVRSGLEAEGFRVQIRLNTARTVHSAFVRLPGLLNDLGLSPHPSQVLAVKVEVDTVPPAGAGLSTTLVRHHRVLNLQHHDRPSLLAGKIHALLTRRYTKGRDLYDLLWYLADPRWPSPNLPMLNSALRQTGRKAADLTQETWRALVRRRVLALDWARVVEDVHPFLEREQDIDLLTRRHVVAVLDTRYPGA